MRIQRALARAGVASRRGAEVLVAEGRVTVNGEVARTGQAVNPVMDKIAVDGKPLRATGQTPTWLVLNKPAGVLTTRTDPGGRKTVFDLVEDKPGLTYVGRLDYMTEGVLLFSTDGDAVNALTHPRNEIERTYVVTVRGRGDDAVRAARRGVELEDGMVVPRSVEARQLSRGLWELEITITEGRKHEIRRLCEALDLGVERLVRTQFGPVKLGKLEPGKTRKLSSREMDLITVLAR